MGDKKEPLDKLVGFNVNAEQKEVLKAMAEYLHLKGIIDSNTYAEAARWAISTVGSMIKEVVAIELSGKQVAAITIPLQPVSQEKTLSQPISTDSSINP